MPRLSPLTAPTVTASTALFDLHGVATLAAAEVVLAQLSGRAPLRIDSVSVVDGSVVRYALAPDVEAMRANRGLMEDVVMAALAAPVAAAMLERPQSAGSRDARALLDAALAEPEEREVLDAYLLVLNARTRVSVRRAWAEISVVAVGLREHGTLDAQDVAHRIACAQNVRGTLLN